MYECYITFKNIGSIKSTGQQKKIHNKHNVVQNSHGIVRQGYTVSFFVTALVSALYNSDVGIVLKRPGDKEFRGFAERLLIDVK